MENRNENGNTLSTIALTIVIVVSVLLLGVLAARPLLLRRSLATKTLKTDGDAKTPNAPPPAFYEDPHQFSRMRSLSKHFEALRAETLWAMKHLPVHSVYRPRETWWSTEEKRRAYAEKLQQTSGWVCAPHTDRPDEANCEWLNLPLVYDGQILATNADRLPSISRALKERSNLIRVAGLSWIRPRSGLPTHTDNTGLSTGSLAYHLVLVAHGDDSTLTVDGQTRVQREGETLIFDSNYPHSVRNEGDKERVLLYVDFKLH